VRLLIETSVVTGLAPSKLDESSGTDYASADSARSSPALSAGLAPVGASAPQSSDDATAPSSTGALTQKEFKRANTESHNILRHFAHGGKTAAAGAQSAFASLEAAVAGFIRQYTLFWKDMMSIVAENVEIKLHYEQLYQSDEVVRDGPRYFGDYSIQEKVALACELLQAVEFLEMHQDSLFFSTCTRPSAELPPEPPGSPLIMSPSTPRSPMFLGSLSNSKSAGTLHERASSDCSSVTSDDGIMCDNMSIASSPRTLPPGGTAPSAEMLAAYYERRCDNLVSIRTAALRYVAIYFQFLVLADYLTLNACRQHVHGYRATTTHTGQPAARLSQLFFTFVFKHFSFNVFMPKKVIKQALSEAGTERSGSDEDERPLPASEASECVASSSKSSKVGLRSASSNSDVAGASADRTMPEILHPYGRTFVAFMNSLPDLGGSADSLIKLCEDVQDRL
jgi:hypothetical protein